MKTSQRRAIFARRKVKLLFEDSAGNRLLLDDDDRLVGINNDNKAITTVELGKLIQKSNTGIKFTKRNGKFMSALPSDLKHKIIPRPRMDKAKVVR